MITVVPDINLKNSFFSIEEVVVARRVVELGPIAESRWPRRRRPSPGLGSHGRRLDL